MARSTYFIQECPTCGRALRIRVEYLGRKLNCPHCRGTLYAEDPSANDLGGVGSGDLLRRADELLGAVRVSSGTVESA
jgi:hypothetical protein